MIVEGANGPIDASADEVLEKRKIDVIPDILANSGGVLVSYYEWLQNNQDDTWSLDSVNDNLEKRMIDTFDKVYDEKHTTRCTYRIAAYKIGF